MSMSEPRRRYKQQQTAKSSDTPTPRRNISKVVGKLTYVAIACLIVILAGWIFSRRVHDRIDLQVTYGPSGVQTLSYKGIVLEDLNLAPGDAFHIWHMKATDMKGNPMTGPEYGWGENNEGKNWNPNNRTWTYNFAWGSIGVQFNQNGNTLDVVVTTTNAANSGIIFNGATIYPFVLNFPQLPNNFGKASYPQVTFNTTGPSVTVASYGEDQVAAVVPDATLPLYSGFWPTGNGYGYFPIISGTAPDGLATFQPHNDRPVLPGQTATYTVSLRFGPSGSPLSSVAADAYRNWATAYPPSLNWPDRRAIGTIYLASSPTGDQELSDDYSNNPRRYFNDSNLKDFDVKSADGLAKFQARVLAQAAKSVATLRMLNAQGSITWDIEGEQYRQPTSYVCAPDEIAQVAPEMESTISDSNSPYHGMKLDDAYFKAMKDAGFRVGVCVRPQHFTLNRDRTAAQASLPHDAVVAELTRKIRYAHDRWGATLFYIDSTVDTIGAVLDASIFKQLATEFPDSLLIPEESTPLYHAYTAPFKNFMGLGAIGTDPSVLSYYPKAFSAVLVNDVDRGKLDAAQAQLTQQVAHGDVLMAHGDYPQADNSTIITIYRNAKATERTTSSSGSETTQTESAPKTLASERRNYQQRPIHKTNNVLSVIVR
jgi:hypothetical protein